MADSIRAVTSSGITDAVRKNPALADAVRTHAATMIKRTTEAEVLETLRANGITSLEALVRETLTSVQGGLVSPGDVGKDTFIYTQAVYKSEMPIPDTLAAQIKGTR
jgi:hypothetical protein